MKLTVAAIAAALLVPTVARAEVKIEEISVRALSQVDGKTYALDALPTDDGGEYPYGGDMEILVGVLTSGTSAKPVTLTLDMRSPGFDSEATGKVGPTKATQKRKLYGSEGKRWVFFVFDHVCDTVTITAKAGKAVKKRVEPLGCAE